MAALSDETGTLKIVHTYGVGLHSGDTDPDVHDPRWQRRQVDDFVEFAVLAEELGFDGITLTEHHAPLMTCPSPHLLLAAAASPAWSPSSRTRSRYTWTAPGCPLSQASP
jgi:Luciferase-like monooxygenase